MKILGIETSSTVFSICLCEDGRLLQEIRKDRGTGPGARDAGIFDEVRRMLDALPGRRPAAVAVATGPGMFTSLRVGVSLAKGICYVHSVPVVGVNTLDCIGVDSARYEGILAAVINAHRGEIFTAFYHDRRRISDHLLTTPDGLYSLAKGFQRWKRKKRKIFIGGPGTAALLGSGPAFDTAGMELLPPDAVMPSSSRIAALAWPRIKAESYDSAESLEPLYLKKTDAERNLADAGSTVRIGGRSRARGA